MNDGNVRKSCPLCGEKIEVMDLYQYSRTYKITKSGRISKRYSCVDGGSMEVSTAVCSSGCGAYWDAGDFEIDSDGRFVDYKYGD